MDIPLRSSGQTQIVPFHEPLPAAAPLRVVAVPVVSEEMLQRAEQIGAEFTLRRIGHRGVASQQVGKECLGEILRLMRRVAAPPHKSIQGYQ